MMTRFALCRLIKVLQLSAEWVLGLFYIAVFDYLVFIVSAMLHMLRAELQHCT
jgi:hypothetical protein